MNQRQAFIAAGAFAIVALTAGCGGGAGATTGSAKKTGSSTSAAPSSAPAWSGGGVWGNLVKLQNFSLVTDITVAGGSGGGGETTTIQEDYFSPTDYKMVINTHSGSPPVTLTFVDKHYYFNSGTQTYNLGTNMQGMADVYVSMGANAWQDIYSGSSATYTGSCNEAGRAGNAYHLSTTVPIGSGSDTIAGNVCIDKATGAPLYSDMKWSLSSGGKSTAFDDRLTVVGVGNVSAIPAPTGAVPFNQ